MEKKRFSCIWLAVVACLVCASISSSPVYGDYMESVHKAWHKHKDNFTINDVFFEIKAGGDYNKVLISANKKAVIVQNGTCVDEFNMTLCLNNTKYPALDLHKEYDPYDYEYYIQILFHLAKLSITKNIEKSDMLIGERSKVDVEIANTGSLAAQNISFRDSYPAFEITGVTGCSYDNKNITWTGSLVKGQRKKCSYYIVAKNAISFDSKAKAAYLAGIGSRKDSAESSAIRITVPEYEIKISVGYNKTPIMVGDNITFNWTIENTRSDRSFNAVELSMLIPDGLDLLSYSGGITASGKLLRWTGKIEESEKKSFNATFKAVRSRSNNLRSSLAYQVESIPRAIIKESNVTALIDELVLQYIQFNSSVLSGSSSVISINLYNPSSRYEFSKIKANITTNLPVDFGAKEVDSIGKKRFASLISKNVDFPDAKEITHYKINFGIEYKTEYGETIKLKQSKTVTVSPTSALVSETSQISQIREQIQEDIEKIGIGRFTAGFVLFVVIFFVSSLHYIKKMVSKVREIEEYEKALKK